MVAVSVGWSVGLVAVQEEGSKLRLHFTSCQMPNFRMDQYSRIVEEHVTQKNVQVILANE